MSAPSAARWRDGRLEPLAAGPGSMPLLAADSWLLEDGAARGLAAHRNRFLGTVRRAAGIDGAAFWDESVAALPRTGAWFPRFELRDAGAGDAELRLLVRPAPERRRDLTVATHEGPDPRRAPTEKGPDLEALRAVRGAAARRGIDDVVLLACGHAAETTTANLAWWVGDALCVPDAGIPQLPGVTVGALVVLARALGVEVREERATPDELEGREIWTLGSLHGIRIVTAWHDGPQPAAEPGRLTLWRRRLDALRRPLPEAVPA